MIIEVYFSNQLFTFRKSYRQTTVPEGERGLLIRGLSDNLLVCGTRCLDSVRSVGILLGPELTSTHLLGSVLITSAQSSRFDGLVVNISTLRYLTTNSSIRNLTNQYVVID